MKEEINNIINEEMEKLRRQKEIANENKRRRIILKLLKEVKESGQDINYNESMSTDELEDIAKEITIEI